MKVNKVLRSVSIYPAADWRTQKFRWEEYLDMVKNYGFNEVFSSMHLPELSLLDQIEGLAALAALVKEKGMELSVDIGGRMINEILTKPDLGKKVRSMGIDFLRLDYGYENTQVKEIYEKFNIHKFVLNASILSQEEVRENVEALRGLSNNIEIRACHNFYPRKETGVNIEFLKNQYKYFSCFNIPVYACAPSMTNPRGPLYEGLPTVEEHRYMPVGEASAALLYSDGCDGLLFGDEFLSEEEIKEISSIINSEPFKVRIHLESDATSEEKDIVLNNIHYFRYDSNDLVLRSQTSRQMAETSKNIKKGIMRERQQRCITIDNELYGRYSGEMQVVLKHLPQDSRINVIAYIDEADQWKLKYFRRNYGYSFYI